MQMVEHKGPSAVPLHRPLHHTMSSSTLLTFPSPSPSLLLPSIFMSAIDGTFLFLFGQDAPTVDDKKDVEVEVGTGGVYFLDPLSFLIRTSSFS